MSKVGSESGTSTTDLLAPGPLGKKSAYINKYTPSLLFPVARKPKREELGISGILPFKGFDLWTGYELSWLNPRGKPVVAISEVVFPCDSPFLAESKSQKLYLNSFNSSRFESAEQVQRIIQRDLTAACKAPVQVRLYDLSGVIPEHLTRIGTMNGQCLDPLDVECTKFMPDSACLRATGPHVEQEFLYTNLLKSNCLVTGQPDWGSVEISYSGPQIDRGQLLKYIVSLRDHNEFHEQCVERIFSDILRTCKPDWLTVYARYTRRGGLDINPYRTNRSFDGAQDSFALSSLVSQHRLIRQ